MSEPVTAIISRQVKVGYEAEFEAWQEKIGYAASQFPGFQGITVMRPNNPKKPEYAIILRFDSYPSLVQWQDSLIRKQLLAQVEALSVGESQIQQHRGLALWFTPKTPTSPPRYKMAILLAVTVFTLTQLLAPQLERLLMVLPLPNLLRDFLVVCIQVSLITYLILPTLTRVLSFWLFTQPQNRQN
jgi:hypothetical protein